MSALDDADAREAALRDLVELRKPLDAAMATLAAFPWDSSAELVVLKRADAIRVLLRVGDDLDPSSCVRWAEMLTGREDLGFEPGSEALLKEFLFELSTPELHAGFDKDVVESWLRRMGEAI